MNKILAYHFDLKRAMWTRDYMEGTAVRLAAWGYSHILLEIENKLQFSNHPALAHTDAFNPEDIPGLRKTGYVNGKPYYGQVFAKDGNLYAGISQTIGQLVPVYATLQESILNLQTTQPSAILRSGSETNSNNPNLNLPNTPDNLI